MNIKYKFRNLADSEYIRAYIAQKVIMIEEDFTLTGSTLHVTISLHQKLNTVCCTMLGERKSVARSSSSGVDLLGVINRSLNILLDRIQDSVKIKAKKNREKRRELKQNFKEDYVNADPSFAMNADEYISQNFFMGYQVNRL